MTKVPLPPLLPPTASATYEPEHVMNYRGGSVLGKKTILKSDHFPGCQNKRLTPQIDGAPNYWQGEKIASAAVTLLKSGRFACTVAQKSVGGSHGLLFNLEF